MTKNNFSSEKKTVPIDRIVPNRFNPNVMSQHVFEKEKESIEKFGLVGAIFVRRVNHTNADFEILDGEHRWKACKEMGYTEIPVEDLGPISDDQTKLLTILFNNLRGKDDIEKRAKLYKEMDEGQLSLLPFSKETIEAEKGLFDFDFSVYEKGGAAPSKGSNILIHLELTKEEKQVWDEACKVAKTHESLDEKQLFMSILKFYVQLRAQKMPEYMNIQF